MILWIPFCIALFLSMKPARAAAVSLVMGLLCLPYLEISFAGLPDYDKTMAVGFGPFVGALATDLKRFLAFRPSWIDLFVVVLILTPYVSGRVNGQENWPAMSAAMQHFIRFGFPWILGRLYLAEPEDQRFFALAFVVGAILYVPLCAFEVKMSPRVHELVYGVKLKSFKHALKGSLWRPNVFMEHGLMCALYMALATVLAFWMWMTGIRRAIFGVGMMWLTAGLAIATIACSSSMALLMMLTGICGLFIAKRFGWAYPLLLLVLFPPVYLVARHASHWDGQELVDAATAIFGQERSRSLQIRIDAENHLSKRTWEKPILGWFDFQEFTGNTGRLEGPKASKMEVLVDSMWLLRIGLYGYVGMSAYFLLLMLPAWFVWKRLPPRWWEHPSFAMAAAFAFMTILFALDCLLNAFENPLYTAAAGGVAQLFGTPMWRRYIAQA